MISLGVRSSAAASSQGFQNSRTTIRIAINAESSPVSLESTPTSMIYYTLDSQFSTLLFSVYTRSERLGLSALPDAICFATSAPSPNSLITYAYSTGIQLLGLGEYYSSLFAQVRVGSVIFLVGVGSLVCWKLWDYWSHGGDNDPCDEEHSPRHKLPRDKSFAKSASKRTKEFIASFLEEEFVQDVGDLDDDDDPALIQGKYFGPESPLEVAKRKKIEESSPLSSECSPKSQSESARQYLADNSYSCLADEDVGFQTSDLEQYDSLPYDDVTNPSCLTLNSNKKVKRRHRLAEKGRSLSSSPSKSPYHQGMSRIEFDHYYSDPQKNKNNSQSKRFLPHGRNVKSPDDFSSPEASPRVPPLRLDLSSNYQRQSRVSPFASVPRRQGDGSETPDSEEFRNRNHSIGYTKALKYQQYANYNSDDEDWIGEERFQPDGEEEDFSDSQLVRRRLSRDISMPNFVGRLRRKSIRKGSLSRDDSLSSLLSEFLKRDESICSNLSEYCPSECSEFSLELSLRDDSIANQTITYFADIEDELNNLKSSVVEIDEEYIRFASRPNPYLFKTTFSDYSLDSDSRPSSALDMASAYKSRVHMHIDGDLPEEDVELVNASEPLSVPLRQKVNFDLAGSISSPTAVSMDEMTIRFKEIFTPEKENHLPPALAYRKYKSEMKHHTNREVSPDPREPVSPMIISNKKSKFFQRQHSNISLKRTVTQEEVLNSLEWDNQCLKQYKEDNTEDFVNGGQEEIDGSKFLPDHASLELDLEKELRESPSTTAFSGREAIFSSLSPAARISILKTYTFEEALETSNKLSPPTYLPSNKSFGSLSMISGGIGSSIDSSGIEYPTSFGISSPTTVHQMTTSIDSAIHSEEDSRSGSTSPLPLMQSMMSSGLGASWCETSPDNRDQESSSWGKQKQKSWSCEKSAIVETEIGVEASGTTLSPVHEISSKEKEQSEVDVNIWNNNFDATNNEDKHAFTNDNEFLIALNDNNALLLDSNRSKLHFDFNSSFNSNIMGNNATRNSDTHLPESSSSQSLTEPPFKAVEDKIEISKYAAQEWRGNTNRSKKIRQGYSVIPDELELHYLRKIRGDNYCGIRAATYQILTNDLNVPSSYQIQKFLFSEINNGASWILEYSFGRRLNYSKDHVIDGFKECLDALEKMSNELLNCENKETVLQARLNQDPTLDVRLCEAVKLNMLVSAIELYRQELSGVEVPLFSMIMFARQHCSNPREFMLNHLNPVGDSAGLEQIEMFLLGYSLQVIVQVVRPSCYGQEDFICFYPDENSAGWPEVTLVAEDDRHYNVLVK